MPGTRRTAEWTVRVIVDSDDHGARAKAVLFIEGTAPLSAKGFARRNPADRPVALIGDALATARAMQRLAEKLTHAAWKIMRNPPPAAAPVVPLLTQPVGRPRMPARPAADSRVESGQGAG